MTSYELTHFKKVVLVWQTKSLLCCSRYDPLMVFWRKNHITFIFIKMMWHELLVQMAYLWIIFLFIQDKDFLLSVLLDWAKRNCVGCGNFLQTVFITGQSESFLRVREVFKPTIQCMFKAEACFALPKETDPIVLKCG